MIDSRSFCLPKNAFLYVQHLNIFSLDVALQVDSFSLPYLKKLSSLSGLNVFLREICDHAYHYSLFCNVFFSLVVFLDFFIPGFSHLINMCFGEIFFMSFS